jgi:hypothetical protein
LSSETSGYEKQSLLPEIVHCYDKNHLELTDVIGLFISEVVMLVCAGPMFPTLLLCILPTDIWENAGFDAEGPCHIILAEKKSSQAEIEIHDL